MDIEPECMQGRTVVCDLFRQLVFAKKSPCLNKMNIIKNSKI